MALVIAVVEAEPFFKTDELFLFLLGAGLGGFVGGYATSPLWGRSGPKGFGWAVLASLALSLSTAIFAGLVLGIGTSGSFSERLIFVPQLMAEAFAAFAVFAATSFVGPLWLVLMFLIHIGVRKMRTNPDMVQTSE